MRLLEEATVNAKVDVVAPAVALCTIDYSPCRHERELDFAKTDDALAWPNSKKREKRKDDAPLQYHYCRRQEHVLLSALEVGVVQIGSKRLQALCF